MIHFTGLTIRIEAQAMQGQARGTKGLRPAVCLGHVDGMGWAFVPTTSSWSASWQRAIVQTGQGWTGFDLRYKKSLYWTPNMVMYLSDEEVLSVSDWRKGWAPDHVVNHGIDELEHAIDHDLMTVTAWFEQEGLGQR